MKKTLSVLLVIFFLIPILPLSYAETTLSLVGESGIVINATTGQVIYSKNPHTPLYPASTTKILTAIIILEDLKLEDVVTIDAEATRAGGSHIALQPDEKVSVKDLLYALMVSSANDAAVALAKQHSGSIEAFAKVMNERAKEMGAINSHFENPNGMPNEKHLTTSYDLAMIAKYAMTNENFRALASARRYEIQPTNKQTEIRYLNSTTSLFKGMAGSDKKITVDGKETLTAYEYADGIKRGYTEDAQYCFVGSATKEERKLITVILKSSAEAMYQDTRNLMDYGFNHTKPLFVSKEKDVLKTIPIQNKKGTLVNGVLSSDISLDLPEGATLENVKKQVALNPSIELPIQKGEKIGMVNFYYKEELVLQSPLLSQEDYIGDVLIDKNITKLNENTFLLFRLDFWGFILSRLLLGILIWRVIITLLRTIGKRFFIQKKDNRT